MTHSHLILIGCGDIGKRVASMALQAGFSHVFGSTRTSDTMSTLAAHGITPLLVNLDDPSSCTTLPTGNAAIVYFVPPPGGGFADTRARNFCQSLETSPKPAKIVYISTTAVYGDANDEWITEETPPAPSTSRGKRRLDAETTFTTWGQKHQIPVVILRVAGIYGPGRLPMQQLLNNHPVLLPAEARPTNRIHADDLATACLAAVQRGGDASIYNVCDGHPGTLTEYFTAAAKLLELPPPPQISMEEAQKVMTPLMLTYVREGHLISNHKLLNDLGLRLRYPSLTEGLASCRPTDWQPPK
jgi:nucleoside-diphosphate-sugar epimerase